MDRKTYLNELEFLLSDISDEERNDALLFYENYFDEAGIENEAKVIEELGEPSKVAAIIKDSIKGSFDDSIESTESGFDNYQYQRNYEVVHNERKIPLFQTLKEKYLNLSSRDKVLLITIILIALIPLSGGLVEVLLSILMIPVILIFGAWIVTIALSIVGIALIVAGVISLFSYAGLGFILMGTGVVVMAIAGLTEKLAKWIFKDVLPYIKNYLIQLFERFSLKGGQA